MKKTRSAHVYFLRGCQKSSHVLLQKRCFENFSKFSKNNCEGVYFQKRFIFNTGEYAFGELCAVVFMYCEINQLKNL